MFFRRFIQLAPVIVIFLTDEWTLMVDATTPILLQKAAGCLDQQEPAILILIDLHLLMGNLPQ